MATPSQVDADLEATQALRKRVSELDRQLRRSREELQDFASALSHDLQSPMNAIMSVVELIREDSRGELPQESEQYLAYITDALERMRRMMQDLVAFARVAHEERKGSSLVDLNALLRKTKASMAQVIRENHAAVTHESLPKVEGYPARLAQVLHNLIDNAIKYRAEAAPSIHLAAERKDDEWVLCVADNGIGFDPKDTERIFGIFKRLHGSEYEGTGIGLPICRKIVEQHGGRIWAESSPGEGSRFYFTLPARR
jgi:light-regulated signal transduction histidine kinase (bacteriophytochrome)